MVNSNKALEVIEFVQALKHTGDFYGKPFVLLPWQIEVINSVYGTVTAEGDFVEQVEIGGSFAETAYRTVKTEMVSVKCFAGIPPCLESSRPAVGIDGVVTVLPRVEDDRIAFPYGKTAKEGVRAVDSDGSYY